MTIKDLKMKIAEQSGGKDPWDTFDLTYKRGDIMLNSQKLKELRLENEDRFKMYKSNIEEPDITVTSDARAAVVKSEGIRLMQQLQ